MDEIEFLVDPGFDEKQEELRKIIDRIVKKSRSYDARAIILKKFIINLIKASGKTHNKRIVNPEKARAIQLLKRALNEREMMEERVVSQPIVEIKPVQRPVPIRKLIIRKPLSFQVPKLNRYISTPERLEQPKVKEENIKFNELGDKSNIAMQPWKAGGEYQESESLENVKEPQEELDLTNPLQQQMLRQMPPPPRPPGEAKTVKIKSDSKPLDFVNKNNIYEIDLIDISGDKYKVYKDIVAAIGRKLEMKPDLLNSDEYRNIVKKILQKNKAVINNKDLADINEYIKMNYLGYGIIDKMVKDDKVRSIKCDGASKALVVEHIDYGLLKTNVVIRSNNELDDLITRLAKKAGIVADKNNPIVDGILPNGARLQATLGGDFVTSKFFIKK